MLEDILQSSQPYLSHYGYWALFLVIFVEGFGLPAPGETLLLAGSALAAQADMNIVAVLLVAWAAAVLGDNIGFAIGRFGGRRLVLRGGRRIGLHAAELERVEAFFNCYGGAIVLVARFVEGLRQLNGIVAGSSGMSWWRFLAYQALGAMLWVGLWGGGAYWFGYRIEPLIRHFKKAELLIAGLAFLALFWAVFVSIRRYRKVRENREL